MKIKISTIVFMSMSICIMGLVSCKKGMKKRQVPTSKDRKAEKPKKQTTVKISPEIDLGESLKNNVVQIKLKNNTSEVIDVAISYMNVDGDWIVSGWWFVNANSEYLLPNVKVKDNSEIYFYAENEVSEWDGLYDKGFNQAILLVSYDEFEYKLKYKSQLDHSKMVKKTFYIGKQEVKSALYTEEFYHQGMGKAN